MNNYLKKLNKHTFAIITIIITLFLFFFYYFGYFKYNYPVPPGDDNIRHMTEAKFIIDNGMPIAHQNSFDPPLFHILLASVSEISGLNIINTTKFLAPFLAILASFSIYFFIKKIFNSKNLGIIALLLFVLISPQPYQIYNDGTYLNLFAASYLLIFTFAFFPSLFKHDQKNKEFLLFILFSASILLSHSLSSTYLYLTLGITILYYSFKLKQKIFLQKKLIYSLISIILIMPFTWEFYLNNSVNKILSLFKITNIDSSNILSVDFSDISPIPSIGTYRWLLSSSLIILCIFGLVFSIKVVRDKKAGLVIAFSWFIALLIGSRTNLFQLPERFARDMAPITTIFASFPIFYLIKQPRFYKITAIIILITLIPLEMGHKVETAIAYDTMVRIQNSDTQAMKWIIKNTPPDAVIMGIPRTIVAGDWGSYIELFTGRKTLDGTICESPDEKPCDQLYNPTSKLSLNYYKKNSIDYVYAGHVILGNYINKKNIDWSYTKKLSKAPFLEKAAEFPEGKDFGKVTIFKVNQQTLNKLSEKNF